MDGANLPERTGRDEGFGLHGLPRHSQHYQAHQHAIWGREPAEWLAAFNGRDLIGWQPSGSAAWTVKSGRISVTPATGDEGGTLWTEATYENYLLAVTFRATWPIHAGIWLRGAGLAARAADRDMRFQDGLHRQRLDAGQGAGPDEPARRDRGPRKLEHNLGQGRRQQGPGLAQRRRNRSCPDGRTRKGQDRVIRRKVPHFQIGRAVHPRSAHPAACPSRGKGIHAFPRVSRAGENERKVLNMCCAADIVRATCAGHSRISLNQWAVNLV